jgi:quinol monooxygenase YgiN
MIVEYIRYKVPADDVATLIAAYQSAGESLRASPHCLGFELTKCTEAEGTLVLRILWSSIAGHIDGFRKGPDFGAFFAEVQPFLGAIEEMRHYELTSARWSR